MKPTLLQAALAEVLGTFLLILFGCGAVHSAVLTGAQTGLWQVAIVWGVAIMLAAYVCGGISGAHINPAITIALALWGRFDWSRVPAYILAQLGGAMLAAAALFLLYGPLLLKKEQDKGVTRGEMGSIVTAMCYGEYYPAPSGLAADKPYSETAWKEISRSVPFHVAFAAEVLGTAVLALVVFAVTDPRNSSGPPPALAPVFIGLCVAILISIIAPLTQACFNPARDFGPRLFAYFAGWGEAAIPGPNGHGFFTVYILAPTIGAVAGGGLYERILRKLLAGNQSQMITRTGKSMNGREKHKETRKWNFNSVFVPLRVLSRLLPSPFFLCLGILPFAGITHAQQLSQNGASAIQDPNQAYRADRSNPVSYAADCSVIVTPPFKTKLLKVWIPMPPSNGGQIVHASEFSTFPMDVKPKIGSEKTYGNQFAYFEFKDPQGAQIIRHKFQVLTYELHWKVLPDEVKAVAKWPAGFDIYRRSESQAVVVDDRFQKLLKQIAPQRTNGLSDLSLVMSWVGENFTYDHHDASLAADSVKALESHRGHCSDYHGFCAAMGRALGYPTRVTYGINTFPKNSPSHCKLEAFLPPYGWVSFDVSETQQLVAAIKKDGTLSEKERADLITAASQRLTSGFRDNTWFLQTVGTDYDLEPPAKKRVPVVRTAYVEADGVALPDPDPADPQKREFAWMTAYEFKTEGKVVNPFADYSSLKAKAND